MMIRYSNKALFYATILLIATGFSGCLKEKDGNFNTGDAPKNIFQFKNTGANVAGSTSFYPAFLGDVGSVSPGASGYFNINLEYGGSGVLSQDVEISLSIDQAVLDTFNTQNKTDYIIPPTDVYSFPSKLTIPKGAKTVTDSAKITRSADYDFDAAYALPIRITAVSNNGAISTNYGSAVYTVNIRNLYDGVYACVAGKIQRYTNPATETTNDNLNGSMAGNPDVTLTTVGAYTVEIGNLKWAKNGGGIGGIDHLQATIDPATNNVTMSCLGNGTLANIAGEVNSYDPDTKTFTLNFDWNQTANRRKIEGLVLKYKGDR